MAIDWTTEQERRVDQALATYHVGSARCDLAALEILPVARERDLAATSRRCTPCFGQFVCPKRRRYFHINVHVQQHYVDSLTGTPGEEQGAYLSAHWPDAEAINWEDLSDHRLEELVR